MRAMGAFMFNGVRTSIQFASGAVALGRDCTHSTPQFRFEFPSRQLLASRPALASRYAYQPMTQPGFAGAAPGYGSEYANYAAASALAAAQQAAVMQQMAAYGGMPGGMPAGMPAVGYGVAMPLSGPMPMSPVPGSPNLFHGHGGGGRQPPLPPPSPSARYSHTRE